MKKGAIIPFALGILLAIAAFCIASVDDIPVLLRFFAPKYVKASQILDRLQTAPLQPGDDGFVLMSELFMQRLARENPPEVLAQIKIREIEKKRTVALQAGGFQYASDEAVRYTLADGKVLKWKIAMVQEEIDQFKQRNLLGFSVALLVLSILLLIIGFVQKSRGKKDEVLTRQIEDTAG